jgi:hypothetical protein
VSTLPFTYSVLSLWLFCSYSGGNAYTVIAGTLQDGNHAFIRLNFNFGPGYEPCAKFPGAICLKELSFRSSDPRHAQRVQFIL